MLRGRVGFRCVKSMLQFFPVVPARVGRRGWGGVMGLLLCFAAHLPVTNTSAQVPVGAFQTFDTRPPATSWSTANVAGGSGDISTAAQLDAAVQNLSAGSMTNQLVSALSSRDANGLVRWNSTFLDVQTRSTGVRYQLLMATLVNDTGLSQWSVCITYTLSAWTASGTTIAEEVPGHRVFYSTTGLANSWILIPELSTNAPAAGSSNALSANIFPPGGWAHGSTLYIVWADDNAAADQNGSGNEEGAYIIDNFLVAPGGPCSNVGVRTEPVGTNVLQCTTLALTCLATGSPPISYQWFKEGQEISLDPFWGGNVTAQSSTFVISNVSLGDAALNFGYNCRVRNGCNGGSEAWSQYAKVDVIADTQGPRLLYTFFPPTNLKQIELTFDEPIWEVDATSLFNYRVWDEYGQEWGITNAVLNAGGTVVTLELVAERNPLLRYSVSIPGNALHDRCNGYGNLDINATVNVEVPLLTIDDGTVWRYNQDGVDPGVAWRQPGFNDSGWGSGQAVFAGDRNGVPPLIATYAVRTALTLTNALWTNAIPTYYFRAHFNFPADPTGLVRLKFKPFIDDAAVIYLNGQEAARYRLGSGPLPWDSYAQALGCPGANNATNTEPYIYLPLTNVVQGDNVIAVEVRQFNATGSDITMGLILTQEGEGHYEPAQITGQPVAVTINEGQTACFSVSARGTDLRFQWYKGGAAIADATNVSYRIANANCTHAGSYTVHVYNCCTSPEVVSAAAVLTVNANTTPPTVLSTFGDPNLTNITVKFTAARPLNAAEATNVANYLFSPSLEVISAALNGTNVVLTTAPRDPALRYTLTVQGISDTSCTPLAIVPYVDQVLQSQVRLMPFAQVWRYFQDGVEPAPNWMAPSYNDTAWPSGAGILGLEPTADTLLFFRTNYMNPPNGINTVLSLRNTNPNSPSVTNVTLYFRTTFNNPLASSDGVTFNMRAYIDDGAVLHLNGAEWFRFNMTNVNPITYSTFALDALTEPTAGGVPAAGGPYFTTNVTGILPGMNTLAVEVHQDAWNSSDLDLGVAIIATVGAVPTKVQIVYDTAGGQVTVSWSGEGRVLEEAPAVTGPWEDSADQNNPQTRTVTAGSARFLRTR